MPEKQLTSEQKKLQEEVRKEAKKEGIPQKDIEKLEDIAGVIGGMGETSKKVLVGSVIALSGAAAGALALYGGQRFNKWYKERNEKTTTTNASKAPIIANRSEDEPEPGEEDFPLHINSGDPLV